MARRPSDTRQHILTAADDLFYAEGLSSVSMDRIAERAGVTKKTLYYHFRSKDDLMGAYLEARRGPVLDRYRGWAGSSGTVAERMRRLFLNLAAASGDRGWRGCGFIRAASELAHLPGHPAVVAARRHKEEFEGWIRSMLEEEGSAESAHLARALMIVLDGAIIETLIHRRPDYARTAAEMAFGLLAARPGAGTAGADVELRAARAA